MEARIAGFSAGHLRCARRTASAEQNEDLFWALRGGGGNFGIVTSFTFRCHEVANVIAGPVFYDLDDAAEVLAWWREFGPAQPDELNGFFAFLSVPPGSRPCTCTQSTAPRHALTQTRRRGPTATRNGPR
jgi:hypothetical protein